MLLRVPLLQYLKKNELVVGNILLVSWHPYIGEFISMDDTACTLKMKKSSLYKEGQVVTIPNIDIAVPIITQKYYIPTIDELDIDALQ